MMILLAILMDFYILFVLLYIALPPVVIVGSFVLLAKLLRAMQRRGVGTWLFAPFRAWTGMDGTRRPKL